MDLQKIYAEISPKMGVLLSVALVLVVLTGLLGAELVGWLFPDIMSRNAFWRPTRNLSSVSVPDYGWIIISYLVILLVVTIASIGIIMGSVFGPKVTSWCKGLLRGAAKSVIILTLAAALFVAFDQMPSDSFALAGFFQINSAIDFVETVRNTIIWEFSTLTLITAIMSVIANITPYLRPAGVIGISFSLAPAFRPVFDSLGMMLSSLSVAIGTWFVQLWLLIFIKTRLLAVFMPLGLFLRSFGYDRTGNVLIAIAIGFYFVFPFVLNINKIAMERYLVGHYDGTKMIWQTADNTVFSDYSSCVSYAKQMGGSSSCFYRLSLIGPLEYLKDIVKGLGGMAIIILAVMNIFTNSMAASLIFSFLLIYSLSILATTVFYVLIVSILIPLFNVFITLTAIKEISKYLGTEIDLSMFEKIF